MKPVEIYDIKTREVREYEPNDIPTMLKRCLDNSNDPVMALHHADHAIVIYGYAHPKTGEYIVRWDTSDGCQKDILWLMESARMRFLNEEVGQK